ncbi:hypothetical protein [Paenibacillus segetis]|uniref:Uncharacterized protein n=1 Tax=Paenibacillus segetis TaxID=1325360 RepID=A0ABQ1Y9W8_9BACL|nr:hypothetical protein [Paenibacillus segetis]GGH16997.1 hypothetical protein GCM10008013_12150 [Paenibacillus segetis]
MDDAHTTNPSGITYQPEYEPDKERMVKALQILKEAPLAKKDDCSNEDELQEGA